MPVATDKTKQQKTSQIEQQKISQARTEIDRCRRDLSFLSRHTSQDVFVDRRLKELLYAETGDLDALRATLWQLKKDFDHLAVATANSAACMRRNHFHGYLETL